MAYSIQVTSHAEELLDELIFYILDQFQDENAASRLLDGLEKVYGRLQDNPFQFPLFEDSYLSSLGVRKARVKGMDYYAVFSISEEVVTILGFYHALENYNEKITFLMLP